MEQHYRIFKLHAKRMTLDQDVKIGEVANSKADMSEADIQAICLDAGLLALLQTRMQVKMDALVQARDKALFCKQKQIPNPCM